MSPPKAKAVPRGTAHFRLVDRLLDGQLLNTMVRLHGESGSWEDVSRQLYADHQIVVTGQTLRRWAKERGIEPEEATA